MDNAQKAFLEELAQKYRERLRGDLGKLGSDADCNGGFMWSVAAALELLAIADYLLKGDVNAFRGQLAQSARYRITIHERYDGHPGKWQVPLGPFESVGEALAAGAVSQREKEEQEQRDERGRLPDSIDPSYATMIDFGLTMFNALAAGDVELAHHCAAVMGGRPEAEKRHDNVQVRVFGYTLKHSILRNREEMQHWVSQFEAFIKKPGGKLMVGYSIAFAGLLERREEVVSNGFAQMQAASRRLFNPMGT